MKLAIVASHPIQYQAPLFKLLAEKIDITVYFGWDFGVKETKDQDFGKTIKWDIPLLEGYKYKFLKNFSWRPNSDFLGEINPGIIKEIWTGSYDAVLVLGWNIALYWMAFFAAILSGKKVLLRGENPLNQEMLKNPFKIFIKKIILGGLFRFVDGFLYIGEENRKFYKFYGVPDKKLFFAPYAVNNDYFMQKARELYGKKKYLKERDGIDPESTTILFAGKFIGKKRPMDLLKAFKDLGGGFSLVFVGDGVLRREMEEYVKENHLKNVHFVGFKNQSEIVEYYAMADIFVLPSGPGETWGLVTNEAMCFGLPVVISDIVGCSSDLVRDGVNGFTFPVGDIGALHKKIIKILQEIDKMKTESEKLIKNYNYTEDIKAIIETLK